MFMKLDKIKKICGSLLVVSMMCVGLCGNVNAANIQDTKFYNNGGSFVTVEPCERDARGGVWLSKNYSEDIRWKENDSYVYFYPRTVFAQGSGSTIKGNIYVDVCAIVNGQKINCGYRYGTSLRTRAFSDDSQYLLTNYAYERYGAVNVTLAFYNSSGERYAVEGLWSPDSVGSYTILQ